MDEQQQTNTDTTSPAPQGTVPTIRTMSGDVETFFQQERFTVTDRIREEAALRKQHQLLETTSNSKTTRLVWIFTVAALFLGGILAFFIFNSSNNNRTGIAPVSTRPLFFVDDTETITVGQLSAVRRQLEHIIEKREPAGTVTHVIIKVGNQLITLYDMLRLYSIDVPIRFIPTIRSSPVMTFVYHDATRNSIGFALETSDPDRILANMLAWESKVAFDIRLLFFDAAIEHLRPFEHRTYRNIDVRLARLSDRDDVAVGYTIFAARKIFIFTTSEQAVKSAIDRLLDTIR